MKHLFPLLCVTFLLSELGHAAATYEKVFKGKDSRTSKPCFLNVIKTYYKGNTSDWADFRAEVSTEYGHGTQTPGEFVIAPTAKSEKHLEGSSSEGKITIGLTTDKDFDSVKTYALGWKHGTHTHNYACTGMKAQP